MEETFAEFQHLWEKIFFDVEGFLNTSLDNLTAVSQLERRSSYYNYRFLIEVQQYLIFKLHRICLKIKDKHASEIFVLGDVENSEHLSNCLNVDDFVNLKLSLWKAEVENLKRGLHNLTSKTFFDNLYCRALVAYNSVSRCQKTQWVLERRSEP